MPGMSGEQKQFPFARKDIVRANLQILKKETAYSAILFLYELDGEKWIVKDFAENAWFVRATIGRFLIGREARALSRVRSVDGMPKDSFRLDAYALCYRYAEGKDVNALCQSGGNPEEPFYEKLEQIVEEMHKCNLVHLDLRNGENILVCDGAAPVILDFQSAADTSFVPGPLRRLLRNVDYSGIYKHWNRSYPDSIGERRLEILKAVNKTRKFWFYKNPILQAIHRLFNHAAVRKVFLRLRAPATIAGVVMLALNIDPALFWYGLAVSMFGELMQLWCFAALDKKRDLAANGPYAVVRNPMYLARYFLVIGAVMLCGNLWVIGSFSLLYYFYMVNRVRREEHTLRQVFGEEYAAYCSNVHRFFPSLKGVKPTELLFFKKRLFLQNHAQWNLAGTLLAWALFYYFAFHYGSAA